MFVWCFFLPFFFFWEGGLFIHMGTELGKPLCSKSRTSLPGLYWHFRVERVLTRGGKLC